MSYTKITRFAARLAGFLLLATSATVHSDGEAATTKAGADPTMPATLRLALIQTRAGEAGAAYQIDGDGRGANPRHGFGLTFTPEGARIDGGSGSFALRLERFGRGAGRPVRRTAPRIDGAWVEYDRGAGLSEWFVNLPGGVEQGWTVSQRPAGEGPLALALDTARPPDASDDQRLAWSGLVYHRLVAVDAAGRELPAAWVVDGSRLRIEVEDRDAVYPLLIDPWVERAKLTADDGDAQDQFGTSVALEGDTALVGAASIPESGPDPGAAYVFIRSGDDWIQQAKLTAADGTDTDQFGASVALAGDTALVGAVTAPVGENPFQGAAYVFTRSGDDWSQQAKLTADDGTNSSFFGHSVALSGDTALVGAPFVEVNGDTGPGAAYVFTESDEGWSQRARLTAEDGAAGDEFGRSVALVGDTALVGSHASDVEGKENQGAAYVFTGSGDTWIQQTKLTAADGTADDQLGVAVALSGDTALVGAWTDVAKPGEGNGAAYVFTRSNGTWVEQAKLTADDQPTNDLFGVAVALMGDTAVVGASRLFDMENPSATYIFIESDGSWSQQAKLTSADGMVGDLFGLSVALEGDTVLVGAPAATVDGNVGEGAVYAFRRELSFAPVALAVDPPELTPEANGVFEPGEAVEVAPTWRNDSDLAAGLTGTASSFTGPAGATYSIDLEDADYDVIEPGAAASCLETEVCYRLALDDPAPRPATHWDATFDETLDDTDGTVKPWTLHIGDSYTDVSRTNQFYRAVETLLHHGISGDPVVASLQLPLLGCSETEFCPSVPSTRAEAAVFLLKGLEGGGYDPPDCVTDEELFDDVPAEDPFCPWIEELAARGVTAGCGGGSYCPDVAMSRAQIAVFLLKTAEGADYVPPECSEVFDDVPCPSLFADWIEDLFVRGISAGCGGGNYCPADPISRAQVAVFVTNTFGRLLYGP